MSTWSYWDLLMAVTFPHFFSAFVVDVFILYPLKTLDNQRFFGISNWNKRGHWSKMGEKFNDPLRKMPWFHLIFWYGHFVERHSFRIVWGESPETMRKICLSTKFPHQIRWNYGVFRSDHFRISFDTLPRYSDEFYCEDVVLWD